MATMTVASLITASIISFTGTIGFIGLVAPHMARIVIGGDNRFLLMTSSLMGALLLLGADAVGRTVFAPAVLPVGLMTSLLGVPLFVYLFMKRRKKSC
jgi:iron complex transport system permease protein